MGVSSVVSSPDLGVQQGSFVTPTPLVSLSLFCLLEKAGVGARVSVVTTAVYRSYMGDFGLGWRFCGVASNGQLTWLDLTAGAPHRSSLF